MQNRFFLNAMSLILCAGLSFVSGELLGAESKEREKYYPKVPKDSKQLKQGSLYREESSSAPRTFQMDWGNDLKALAVGIPPEQPDSALVRFPLLIGSPKSFLTAGETPDTLFKTLTHEHFTHGYTLYLGYENAPEEGSPTEYLKTLFEDAYNPYFGDEVSLDEMEWWIPPPEEKSAETLLGILPLCSYRPEVPSNPVEFFEPSLQATGKWFQISVEGLRPIWIQCGQDSRRLADRILSALLFLKKHSQDWIDPKTQKQKPITVSLWLKSDEDQMSLLRYKRSRSSTSKSRGAFPEAISRFQRNEDLLWKKQFEGCAHQKDKSAKHWNASYGFRDDL